MDWNRLLSHARLGRNKQVPIPATSADFDIRTDFQRDFDRIVFSSAFRRLQDKTQVFPLAQTDYVRTRLTHSLEASSVGRTLGIIVGEEIIQRYHLSKVYPQDFGAIVAAACLAHDIGNPPFGHAGENAIRLWFSTSTSGRALLERLDESRQADLLRFEGNAQGFRLLTRLQSPANYGGMQLTCATLGAFSKYPCAAWPREGLPRGAAFHKHGFFQADEVLFRDLANALGLIQVDSAAWCRHPLSYLVEAADDICYRIVDVEDAFRLHLLSYAEAEDLLLPLLGDAQQQARLHAIHEPKERIEFLRAKAIGLMVEQTARCFVEHEVTILAGELEGELLDLIPNAAELKSLLQRAEEQVYVAPQVIEVGVAGFEVLGGLLERFISAVNDIAEHGVRASPRSQMLLRLVPEQFVGPERRPAEDLYQRVLGITDLIAGMTDSYAVNLYKKLTGISLPAG